MNLGIKEVKKPGLFRFEKWWLEQPDFKELVAKTLAIPCAFTDVLDVWQFKIRLLRKKMKGWAISVNASLKKTKKELLEFQKLDCQSEKIGCSFLFSK